MQAEVIRRIVMGRKRRSMALANLSKVDPEIPLNRPASMAEVAEVYAEMFHLLEEYGPVWYTEELHERAAAGLEILQRLSKTSGEAGRRAGN